MGKAKSAIDSQREMIKRAKEFIEDVKKEIRIENVYIVGSRARGDYLDKSDIDLVIISRDFEGMKYTKRLEMLSKYIRPGLEFFAYTPEEWNNSSSLYVKEMKKEAKRLDEIITENY
ncbi:nucleotidyltransferase domain-containing protein [Acidianus brierleyi]|uniref:Nucleotidyltransferase n=1 Tax=Acidianus brierleyi TaxID=41673 RepID=A0A2U9IGS2_9CREN|nr:nucleotidyltransferase domain-containing protein [Acidianus brierleyi]AWR95199.1 nucleotidyltransferase domain-containing protein [Acidianus brierleyi]